MPTRMNSRIGKYSASIVWCPRADSNCYGFLGHQPLKLACLPISPRGRIRNYLPKLLRHRFFALRRRGFLRLRLRFRSFRFLLLAHRRAVDHAARLARLIRREIREREAGDKEDRGENRGGARKEVRRAGGAEEAPGSAAAEARAHVRALAVLEKHQADDRARHHHVQHDRYVEPYVHLAALTISMKSFATSEAPPISPPSTSGWAKIAAAFCAFTLPPYRIRVSEETLVLRKACTAWACSGVAVLPVPIAHTGSYARTAFSKEAVSSTAASC